MLLLADIGNTSVHLGIWSDGEITRQGRVPVEEIPEGLDAWKDGPPVEAMVVASVNPRLRPALAGWCSTELGQHPLEIGREIPLPIPVEVDRPGEVGVDRVLNAAAAHDRCRGACIVVDCGTAVTLDAVSSEGSYVGGAIAPGVHLSARALSERTALIPPLLIRPTDVLIGRNTEEAVRLGIVHGFGGLVDRLVRRLRRGLGGNVQVFATGGDAHLVAPHSEEIREVLEDLTLHGMRIAYELGRG